MTEDELRQAVSEFWSIDEIRPAFIHANIPAETDYWKRDDQGRVLMSAYLLTAHRQ